MNDDRRAPTGRPAPMAKRPSAPARTEPARLHSTNLLRGAAEVLIEHETQLYRLRRTASGKLILTK